MRTATRRRARTRRNPPRPIRGPGVAKVIETSAPPSVSILTSSVPASPPGSAATTPAATASSEASRPIASSSAGWPPPSSPLLDRSIRWWRSVRSSLRDTTRRRRRLQSRSTPSLRVRGPQPSWSSRTSPPTYEMPRPDRIGFEFARVGCSPACRRRPTERRSIVTPERGDYDRATIDQILDEALICHVAFNDGDGAPRCLPTIHARVGDNDLPARFHRRTSVEGAPRRRRGVHRGHDRGRSRDGAERLQPFDELSVRRGLRHRPRGDRRG